MLASSNENHGFSLVELSIVLVILGLLVGGVLSGQSLIRAAELRAVTSEYSRYVTATQSFRDKYFALPGDMTNATAFWGVAHATPATCVTTASSSPLTCNGNGDGILLPSAGSNESFRFWQHLANAGLIEGTYNGITQGTSSFSSTTANSPISKLSQGLWFAWNWNGITSDSSVFDGNYGNILQIGGFLLNNEARTPLFKPEEAWNIDTKLDDGLPGRGKMIGRDFFGFTGTNCTTATASTQSSATYYLAGTSKTCTLFFREAF